MSLTHTSTIADAEAQLLDNLSWDGSATKQAAALEAVRYLLARRSVSSSTSTAAASNSTQFSEQFLLYQEKALREAVQAANSANRAGFVTGRARLT